MISIKNTFLFICLFLAQVNAVTENYEYKIVSQTFYNNFNNNAQIFSNKVAEHLNSGWELAGSMIHSRSPRGNDDYFIQSLVKKTEIHYLEPF